MTKLNEHKLKPSITPVYAIYGGDDGGVGTPKEGGSYIEAKKSTTKGGGIEQHELETYIQKDENPEEATKKEVHGWYLYDWANGAWFYSAMNFLPLMITAQARETAINEFCVDTTGGLCDDMDNSWAEDFQNLGKCDDLTLKTNSTCVDAGNEWKAELSSDANKVNFLGIPFGFASVAQFATTISVILQLILFITMGSFADYGANRKKMFIGCNTIGIVAALSVVFVSSDSLWWVNSMLFITGVVVFSFAQIFYNAYLPLLAKAVPEQLLAKENGASKEQLQTIEKKSTHNMSIRGLASGFTGQLVFLLMNLALLKTITSEKNLNTRLCIFSVGIWMILFSTITFMRLKTRPGPPLPPGENYCYHSIHGAYKTLLSFKKLNQLGRFLFAYFVFSDGTSTLSTSAAVFAQEELAMNQFEIALALVEVSITAALGCFFFKWIHEKYGVSSKTILIFNLCVMATIPTYSIFFLTQKWEFYFGIFIFGFNTGSQQSFTRSIFASNLPKGRESEYFSFYEISDRGTAWLGPLVVGLVNQATGSYRDAFATLIIFFVAGVLLLLRFDPIQAEKEKNAFDQEDAERSSLILRNSLDISKPSVA